ncbi:hypothetical protein PMI42_00118 [Bradyrhizobium sp. YR681]|nr:hypothetical protein PMI42_00118 [Bradyrhizobium sp. YR681]
MLLGLMLASVAGAAVAQDWGNMATISSTLGNNTNRLCIGDHSRPGDIGCPTWAPSLTTAGNVIVSGSVTAAQFIGDGSGLTNVGAASTDRITSGTTSMLAISSTGFVSLTQSGVNTGWFDPTRGLVTIGVSSTGSISGTSGYFGGKLTVVNNPIYLSSLQGLYWGGVNNSITGHQTQQYLSFLTSGTEAMRIVSSGYVGIGTSQPSSTLHVAGSVTVIGPSGGQALTIYSSSGGGSTASIASTGSFSSTGYGFKNDGTTSINTASYNNLSFYVNSQETMRLKPNLVGINTITPTTSLEVSGTVSATRLVVNGVSITGASANLSETVSLNDLKDVSASTSLGTILAGPGVVQAITPTGVTAFGVGAMGGVTDAGTANTAIGNQALYSMNNVGALYNTAVGSAALYADTSGQYNVAVGKSAMSANTTGSYNAALGTAALAGNVGGVANTAVGNESLRYGNGNYNTAVGNSAGGYAGAGLFNTIIGQSAGYGVSGSTNYNGAALLGYRSGISLTTGSYNTLLGFQTGYSLTSGGSNTLVGAQAGTALTTGAKNIVIGANTDAFSATGSNQLNIGNAIWGNLGSGTSNANLIGINVANPTTTLEVSGTISATSFVVNGVSITGASANADRIVSGSVNMIAEQTSGTVRVSGTLALVNTGNEVCGPATWYSFRVDPVSGQMQMCRP